MKKSNFEMPKELTFKQLMRLGKMIEEENKRRKRAHNPIRKLDLTSA